MFHARGMECALGIAFVAGQCVWRFHQYAEFSQVRKELEN